MFYLIISLKTWFLNNVFLSTIVCMEVILCQISDFRSSVMCTAIVVGSVCPSLLCTEEVFGEAKRIGHHFSIIVSKKTKLNRHDIFMKDVIFQNVLSVQKIVKCQY